jgi:hypothetical protein
MPSNPSRRAVLAAIGAATGAVGRDALAAQAPASAPARPLAFRGQHAPEPLPFDPAKLKGAAAARYVDAFMENVPWDEVSRRVEWARGALRG